jgi:hypothetical protein
MADNILQIMGIKNTYENAEKFVLAFSDHDTFISPEEIPGWVKEMKDYPDPFGEDEEE